MNVGGGGIVWRHSGNSTTFLDVIHCLNINTEGGNHTVHCTKVYRFSRPQPGCHLPNSPWTGIIWLLPFRESLVSDIPVGDGKPLKLLPSREWLVSYIPAGDGKTANLFLQCSITIIWILFAGWNVWSAGPSSALAEHIRGSVFQVRSSLVIKPESGFAKFYPHLIRFFALN
jgi:hypothetical protein